MANLLLAIHIFFMNVAVFDKGGDRGRSIESAYTNKNRHSVVSVSVCGGYEIRTHDLLHAMQAL